MKWFSVNLTKSLFTGAIKNAIPVIGGVIGGSITFVAFKPCCYRLKAALQDTMLSNPNHVSTAEEAQFVREIVPDDTIEAEFTYADPSSEEKSSESL